MGSLKARLANLVHERPFLVSLVVLLLVVVPGMIRIEMIARDARETAKEVERQNQVVVFNRCAQRNTSARDVNISLNHIFDELVKAGARPESVDPLRAQLPEPAIDCNDDGAIDEGDYFP